jgi:integrase
MRQGEILDLTWDQLDLKAGFIRMRPEDTKTNDGRLVPFNQELMEMFKAMPRGLPGVKVFTYAGRQTGAKKKGFTTACKRAEIEDFTWRLQGHDYFRIMAATGHKDHERFQAV